MGGAEDIFHPSSLIYTDGAPHAEVRRPEPIPDHPRTWRHAYRGHRDEPVELARCRYCAWGRAPAVEEARNRRERIAETAASMAGGSEESRTRIERIAVAFEAGRDGFWLARWLKARGIEAYVIHASSIAVSREHRRAKTDRLDTQRRSSAPFSVGCAASVITARWSKSRQQGTRTPKRPNRERDNLIGERSRDHQSNEGSVGSAGHPGASILS